MAVGKLQGADKPTGPANVKLGIAPVYAPSNAIEAVRFLPGSSFRRLREMASRNPLAIKRWMRERSAHPEFPFPARTEHLNGIRSQRVSVRPNDAFRLQQQVDAEILASAFRDYAVTLNSQRVEKYLKSSSLIVESIEVEAHIVIAENVVAFSERGSHLVRFIVGAESDVKKLRIVTEQDFGRFGSRVCSPGSI